MARFDVYARANQPGYLLDVQADLLGPLNTRVVVPLMLRADAPRPADRLNPCFEVHGLEVVMVTQFMAAIPAAELKRHVTSLDHAASSVLAAIDFLHQGW